MTGYLLKIRSRFLQERLHMKVGEMLQFVDCISLKWILLLKATSLVQV